MQIILLLLSFFSTKTYIIDANTNYLKTNIIINKTDINNDGIASATFNLYKDNKIINTYKTDDNGRIILSLDNGKYTLKETTKTTWFKLEKINLNVENKDLGLDSELALKMDLLQRFLWLVIVFKCGLYYDNDEDVYKVNTDRDKMLIPFLNGLMGNEYADIKYINITHGKAINISLVLNPK